MAALPWPVLALPQLCLSLVQLWAAPSSTSHSSSARAGRDRDRGEAQLPLHRPRWGKPFPSIFQQEFHNSTLDMPWMCFVGCRCHLVVA